VLLLFRRILAVVYVTLLTAGLASQSFVIAVLQDQPHTTWVKQLFDVGHFLSMLMLGILVPIARFPLPQLSIIALLLGYAVMMEYVQLLLPARVFDWKDLAQNLAGVISGMTLVYVLRALLFPRRQEPTTETASSLFAMVHDLDKRG
jgi:VanZ family protein